MKKLFHISFRNNLEGRWEPRLPAGSNHKNKEFRETDIPRISFAPTIEQCFWGIYQNVKRYFISDGYPFMNFHVYAPRDLTGVKLIETNELVRKKMVPDAHITQEVISITDVDMIHIGEVKVYNCLKNPIIKYHPYGDASLPLKELSHQCKIELIKGTFDTKYINASNLMTKNMSLINRWSLL